MLIINESKKERKKARDVFDTFAERDREREMCLYLCRETDRERCVELTTPVLFMTSVIQATVHNMAAPRVLFSRP